MILLDSSDSLQVLLAGAITTSQGVLYAAYADHDATSFIPGSTSGATNSTTAVDWVTAPAAGKTRQIKYLSLYNADTVAMVATVRVVDNATNRILIKKTLAAGERLEYVDGDGFQEAGSSSSSGGSTSGRHAVYVPAGGMSPSNTGGCAALATIASAANQPDIQTLDFDTTTQEYAQFAFRMPKSWDEGTVTFAPVWSHAATTTNFGVVWDLQAVAVSDDDAIAVAFGTAQTSTDTGGTTNDVYIGPESSAITIAGTPAAEDVVFFRLSRVTGNGSDTMAIDARLHGVTVYMTTHADTDA
jgi:hypothetical protein